MDINIRKGQRSDLAEILRMTFTPDTELAATQDSKDRFVRDCLKPKTLIKVIEKGDDIVGYFVYTPETANRVRIVSLLIDEQHRGNGYSKKALDELSSCYASLRVEVDYNNYDALRYLAHNGFKPIKEKKSTYLMEFKEHASSGLGLRSRLNMFKDF